MRCDVDINTHRASVGTRLPRKFYAHCLLGCESRLMDLSELGEFGAIALFRELLEAGSDRFAPADVGIGDDAAVWRPTAGRAAIETTDLLIEEVHFSLRWCSWYDVGWKAMAVNLSDVAAMGGVPRAAFVSAGLSPRMSRADVLELYRGLAECAAAYGTAILGGDTVASPAAAAINVAVHGETLDGSGAVLRRDQARPGDAVAVSGPLGASAAYLRRETARAGGAPAAARPPSAAGEPRAADDELRRAHLHPEPRVELGQRLVRAGVRCGMDVSDGLLADLGKLCAASSVGAKIAAERVPIASSVRKVLPDEALELALTGGEDYELLACGAEQVLQEQGLAIVGHITTGGGVNVRDAAGRELRFASQGYDAFRRPADA
jgi:thiamine-monophosphate kinase